MRSINQVAPAVGSALGVVLLAVSLVLVLWPRVFGPSVGANGVSSEDGANGSIKVQGEWIGDGLDPDGRLVSRRVFSNALVQGGQAIPELCAVNGRA